MSKKNIFFISTWFPNRVDQLNGIFVQRHADCIQRVANLVVLNIQLDTSLANYELELCTSTRNGYKIVTVYYASTSTQIEKYLQIIRAYRKGIRFVHQQAFSYDIIHANISIHAGIIAKLLSLKKKIPYIITEHSSAYLPECTYPKGKLFYKLSSWTSKGAKHIMPVSKSLSLGMQHHKIEGNYTLIPNVIDSDIFHYTPGKKKYSTFTFLHISSLKREIKNPEGILEAAKILSKTNKEFQLAIAGNSNRINQLSLHATSIGLSPSIVKFYGFLNEAEVVEMMQQSHCFLLFSNYETQGCVLLEAQACGLPAIGTIVGGVPEILPSTKQGILIPANDTRQLAEAMSEIIQNYDHYDKAWISNNIKLRYSTEVISKKIQSIYETL